MVTLANLVTAAAAAVLLSGHHHHVLAARLTKVNYLNNATSKAEMYIYVPDRVVSSPPLVVVIHSYQFSPILLPKRQNHLVPKAPHKKGYITLWPSSPQPGARAGTCLSSRALARSRTATAAAAVTTRRPSPNMVRVHTPTDQYGVWIASASTSHGRQLRGDDDGECHGRDISGAVWGGGSVARNMYPGHDGPRPKMQIWHGSVDSTLAPANYQETIKLWINVFGVDQTPTRSQKNYPQANYQTDDYGEKVQGIHAAGVGHSVPANLTASELWFGL